MQIVVKYGQTDCLSEKCEKCEDHTEIQMDIVLFPMNFNELLNCWKILFVCFIFSHVIVLLIEYV